MFFCAPEEILASALESEAARRGLEPLVSWQQLLSPGNAGRLRAYDDLRKADLSRLVRDWGDDGQTVSTDVVEDLMPRCIVDLAWEPSERPRMASHLMTLMQKTMPWSFKLSRPMLAEEGLDAQGVLVYDHLTHDGMFVCPYQSLLGTLSEWQKRSLAGNAICIPVIGLILCFIMAATGRRDEIQLCPALAPYDDGEDEEEGELGNDMGDGLSLRGKKRLHMSL